MSSDARQEVYQSLHKGQLAQQELNNRTSAQLILGMVLEYLRPNSVLDVGCGLGTWLAVAHELGITDCVGIEGSWLDPQQLQVPAEWISKVDLENGFSLGRKFELAICLEVAEHLEQYSAERFVDALTLHSDIVLFSAAIPFQGGHHHVNEQFLDYWINIFAKKNFRPLDLIRPRIWSDPSVLWWLRQNIVVMAHDQAIEANLKFREERTTPRPLSIVHPDVYFSRMQHAATAIQERDELFKLLSEGGAFTSTKLPDGRITISRLQVPSTSSS